MHQARNLTRDTNIDVPLWLPLASFDFLSRRRWGEALRGYWRGTLLRKDREDEDGLATCIIWLAKPWYEVLRKLQTASVLQNKRKTTRVIVSNGDDTEPPRPMEVRGGKYSELFLRK